MIGTVAGRLGKAAVAALPLLLFLAAWAVLGGSGRIDADFLPTLPSIAAAFMDLLRGGELLANLGGTLVTGFLGLAAGIVAGVLLGILMAVSRPVESFFDPLVKVTYAVPKTALIPLLVLVFGVGGATNVIIVAVTTLLPMIVYTMRGVRTVPRVLRWSALSLGTSRRQILWRILLPSALPSILTGARIALGFMFVVVIACEMVVSNYGIGKLAFLYGDNGNYRYMFAALIAIVAVAFLADALLGVVSAYWLRWVEASAKRG